MKTPIPSGSRTNQIHNTIYFPRSNRNASLQIDHLPKICKSSSLFVDPSSRVFISSPTKPWQASGNNQTSYAYPNIQLI